MPTRPALRVTCAAVLLVLAAAGPAAADDLVLPAPETRTAQEVTALCTAAGGLPDRCRPSVVPGDVRNDEVVLVGMAGDGSAEQVQLEQRLVLQGVGDYAIRERGPARAAVALVAGDDPPNTKFGAVVWQGFTPGDRRLGARLTLDAALEAARLPMTVTITFTDASGSRPLQPGGRVPGPGTVAVHLENRTSQPTDLPTGEDVRAAAVARGLDVALRAARSAPGPRLPSTEDRLPARLPVTKPAAVAAQQSVPLRVTGRLLLTGSAAGPGLTPVAGGATVEGTLTGTVDLTATASAAGPLDLQLTAIPALDPRLLAPPGGARTWAAWAAGRPDRAARKAALDLLVQVAATGARASSYSPYLGADLPGTGSTVFRYAFAVPEQVAAARPVLHPKRGPITLACLAFLLLLGNGALIWRES